MKSIKSAFFVKQKVSKVMDYMDYSTFNAILFYFNLLKVFCILMMLAGATLLIIDLFKKKNNEAIDNGRFVDPLDLYKKCGDEKNGN